MPQYQILTAKPSQLKDKIVVLSGGASGIGAATTARLVEEGTHVFFGDVNNTEGLRLAESWNSSASSTGGSATFVHCDISKYDEIYQLFKTAYEKHGRIDHAVANAGIIERGKWFDADLTIEEVGKRQETTQVLDINVTGTVNFARIASVFLKESHKIRKEQENGHVPSLTILGSVASIRESPGMPLYQMSKHAVLGLMRAIRKQLWERDHIRVNCVCPGFTESAMTTKIFPIFKERGLGCQTSDAVAQIIVSVLVDEQLVGKSIYVENATGWEFEDGFWDNMHVWLGERPAEMLKKNAEFISNVGIFVRGCRGNFDFKIGFEFVFLLAFPQVLFALVAILRCVYIARQRKVAIVAGGWLLLIKQLLNLASIWAKSIAVSQWTLIHYGPPLDLVTEGYKIVRLTSWLAFLALAPLSYLDHRRTLRPSSTICIFLAVSLVLDLMHIRSIALTPPIAEECYEGSISLQFVACAAKFLQLCAESTHKTRWVLRQAIAEGEKPPAEERHGVFSRMIFLWVNPLVWHASRKMALDQADLYKLPTALTARCLDHKFRQVWRTTRKGKRGIRDKGGLRSLAFRVLRSLYLEPVPPRLILLAFTLCQPLLLRRLLEYLETPFQQPPDLTLGYSIMAASVFVYFNIAVFSALCWSQRSRIYTATRGLLQTEIYRKVTKIPIDRRRAEQPEQLEASIEQIATAGRDVHEIWANALQIWMTVYMLSEEIQLGCVAPIALYLLAFTISVPLRRRQERLKEIWEASKTARTGLLIDFTQSSRAATFLGLVSPIAELVRCAREEELESLRSLQLAELACSAAALLPAVLSPPAAFGLYLATGYDASAELDLTRIFTALSILLLLGRALSAEMELLFSSQSTLSSFAKLDRLLATENRPTDATTGDEPGENVWSRNTFHSTGHSVEGISSPMIAASTQQEENDDVYKSPAQPDYRGYLKMLGLASFALILVIGVACGFLAAFPYVWLSWWAEANQSARSDSSGYFLGVYTALQLVVAIISLAGISLSCFYLGHRASRRLVEAFATALLSAPDKFTGEPKASLLSQMLQHDVDAIDNNISRYLFDFGEAVFIVTGQATLVAFVSPWMALVFVLLTPVYIGAEKMFIKARTDLESLEQQATRTLHTHLAEIFQGPDATTELEQQDRQIQNQMHIDAAQKPRYLLTLTQGLLHLILDVVTALVVAAVTALLLHFRGQIANGTAAIALTVLVSFSIGRQAAIRSKGDLDISLESMTCIQKAVEGAGQSKDPSSEDHMSPTHWPRNGIIEFDNVFTRESGHDQRDGSADDTTPLNNVNLRVEHGQRVAICGDVDSGKSQVADAIMRMCELSSGSIFVGGSDISKIPKEIVYSAIIGLGPNPYLLPGSIRRNLEVEGQFSEDETQLHQAIDLVRLSDLVSSLGGLDAKVNPTTISVEQAQMLCLARAMLRRSNVVVLDRPASKVDAATAALIRAVVYDWWREATVIEILDKLDNVAEYDVAVVMRHGEVIEVNRPASLLSRESVLRTLRDAQQAEPL